MGAIEPSIRDAPCLPRQPKPKPTLPLSKITFGLGMGLTKGSASLDAFTKMPEVHSYLTSPEGVLIPKGREEGL